MVAPVRWEEVPDWGFVAVLTGDKWKRTEDWERADGMTGVWTKGTLCKRSEKAGGQIDGRHTELINCLIIHHWAAWDSMKHQLSFCFRLLQCRASCNLFSALPTWQYSRWQISWISNDCAAVEHIDFLFFFFFFALLHRSLSSCTQVWTLDLYFPLPVC